jgi:hypothetical protein
MYDDIVVLCLRCYHIYPFWRLGAVVEVAVDVIEVKAAVEVQQQQRTK